LRIAIIYQYYRDHGAPGHSLVYELSHYLAARGHQVDVTAGETGYMAVEAPSLPWYRRLLRRETDGNVTVTRVLTPSSLHQSYAARLMAFLTFTVLSSWALLFARRPDVVLASSPPIFPAFTAWIVCALRRIPLVVEIRDLWPASAVQMGIVRNRLLVGIMSFMERVLYNRARHIIALTGGIRNDIVGRGWSAGKVSVITCGIDLRRMRPSPEEGKELRKQNGWEGKFVVLYFGAIGEANNMPVILRAAERLEDATDIRIVVVGDGMKRSETIRTVEEKRLANVDVLPAVPKSAAAGYISACDICLVTLRDVPLFEGAIPTKLIDYMACAKPVLCGVRGEAREILEESGAGYAFEPDDDEMLARLVREAAADPDALRAMGERGLAFARSRFSLPELQAKTETILLAASRD
jgi:glycosyltransferase involved in cell wall biosynthesis